IVPPEDKHSYAQLMYDYSFRSGTLALPNSFFSKTLLKRRIDMLYQQKTPKMKAAYLLVVPLLAVLLAFTSRDAVQPRSDKAESAGSRSAGTPVAGSVPDSTNEKITVTGTVTDAAGKAMAG